MPKIDQKKCEIDFDDKEDDSKSRKMILNRLAFFCLSI